MHFCLKQGSTGPEIGMLVENLRILGFDLEPGTCFTRQVSGALAVFQQSYHDQTGLPLKLDGCLSMSTALALDRARGRARQKFSFDEREIAPMSEGGNLIARRAALIAMAEYMRACGEQGGDNMGPDIERYSAAPRKKKAGWTIDFVAYGYREAFGNDQSPFGNAHDTTTLLAAAQSQGWIVPSIEGGLLPGDLIIWHFFEPSLPPHPFWQGQAGIVWSYDATNIITFEGDRGPYPSLVRPYRHNAKDLVRVATNGQLRDGISVVRVT